MFLVYDIETKRVLFIYETKPANIPNGTGLVYSNNFQVGDELDSAIYVQDMTYDDVLNENVLTTHYAYKVSVSTQELLKSTRKALVEIDSLKTINADLTYQLMMKGVL